MHNRTALQRVVRSAQHITGGNLPALQDPYPTRCPRKAKKILKGNTRLLHYSPVDENGGKLPALQDTYTTRCHRKAKKIIKDNNHLRH